MANDFLNECSTSDGSSATTGMGDGYGSAAVTYITVYVIVVVVVGFTGNIHTIFKIMSVQKLRTTANTLVASQAIADAGIIAVSIPVIYSRFRFPEFHESHPVLCRVSYFWMLFFVATSVNHSQLIAFNRYFIVSKSRYVYRKYWGRRGTAVAVVAVWLYAIFIISLPFVGFGEIDYIPELGGCGIVEAEKLSWWYKTYLLLIVVQSCGVVTPLFFILTFKKIHSVRRRLESSQDPVIQTVANLRSSPKGFSRHEMAVTKMTVASFLCFLVCWSPYIILHLVTVETQKPGATAVSLLSFAYSNSVFNAFIYAGSNVSFRSGIVTYMSKVGSIIVSRFT